jgi:LacI family transcriptional regulator
MPRSTRIGVILDENSSYGRQVIIGLAEYACQHNWQVLRHCDHQYRLDLLARADGLIGQFVPGDLVEALRAHGCRMVNVSGRMPVPELPLVTIDNQAAGEMAARYFLERGFTRLACMQNTIHLYAAQRRDGFHRVAAHAHVPCIDYPEIGTGSRISITDDPQLCRWLHALPKPIGLLGTDEIFTVMFTHTCHALGIAIPDDLAVMSINDDPYECRLAFPPLTSVQVPGERIGFEAARMLHRLIDGDTVPAQPLLLAPTGVTTRTSTEIMPIIDADIRAALAYIAAHFHEPIDTHDVLQQVEVGRRTLERRFHEVRGHAVRDEIRRHRVSHARDLLLSTALTLNEIAHAVGYAHRSTFIRVFHEAYDLTPAAFRRQFGGRQTCKPTS